MYYKDIKEYISAFSDNANIMHYSRKKNKRNYNIIDDITLSYDLQSGSCVDKFKNDIEFRKRKIKYCFEIKNEFDSLCNFNSILEAGVGECITLENLLCNYESDKISYGFDISLSRLLAGSEYNTHKSKLFLGAMNNIPLKDNSIDIVYTSYSIEPNTNKEIPILKELYRVTRKYLVLIESAFDLANIKQKERMMQHKYINNLYSSIKGLNYKIICHKLFDCFMNDENPSALTIIEKTIDSKLKKSKNHFCCPNSYTDLIYNNNFMYSEESALIYPVIKNIPCLLKENAIFSTYIKKIIGDQNE